MSVDEFSASRLGQDLKRSFDASNPKPIEYLQVASSCLDRAKLAVEQGLPIDAEAWLRTCRTAFETAYKLEEVMR
jgi:hypothetical protein